MPLILVRSTFFHALFLGLCTSALVAGAQESEAPAYQVDVVLFEHSEPFTGGEVFDLSRVSPFIPVFSDLTQGVDLDADDEAQDAPEPEPRRLVEHDAVPDAQLMLRETAAGIDRAQRFKLLGHIGWRQDALPTEEAPAQRVALGGVRGSVLLSRSRFLRLDLDLNFSVDGQPIALKQTRRRVQLGQPHYIDHPYIGAIVQVSRPPKPPGE